MVAVGEVSKPDLHVRFMLTPVTDRPPRGYPDNLAVQHQRPEAASRYAGYRKLADRGDVRFAFCWSHVRRYALNGRPRHHLRHKRSSLVRS